MYVAASVVTDTHTHSLTHKTTTVTLAHARRGLTNRPLTNVDLVDHTATFLWLALITH